MKLNRRDFLKLSGAGIGAAVVLSSYTARIAMAAGGNFPLESTKAVLHDATKCIGCKVCEQACRKSNELLAKPNTSPQLSASTWTIIHSEEVEVDGKLQRIFTKWQCMHCQHPACVSACPVGDVSDHGCRR